VSGRLAMSVDVCLRLSSKKKWKLMEFVVSGSFPSEQSNGGFKMQNAEGICRRRESESMCRYSRFWWRFPSVSFRARLRIPGQQGPVSSWKQSIHSFKGTGGESLNRWRDSVSHSCKSCSVDFS
jgi:hypothetical protein